MANLSQSRENVRSFHRQSRPIICTFSNIANSWDIIIILLQKFHFVHKILIKQQVFYRSPLWRCSDGGIRTVCTHRGLDGDYLSILIQSGKGRPEASPSTWKFGQQRTFCSAQRLCCFSLGIASQAVKYSMYWIYKKSQGCCCLRLGPVCYLPSIHYHSIHLVLLSRFCLFVVFFCK